MDIAIAAGLALKLSCLRASWFQGCPSGAAQRDPAALRHEEDQPPEPDPTEPDSTGVRGERHPHLRGEPLRRQHVLLLRDPQTPVYGHGVCGG